MMRSPSIRIALLLFAALVVPACHDGGAVRRTTPPGGFGALTLKAALLSGRQEVPPVSPSATGAATLDLDASRTTVVATVTVSGLADITAAHIHVGAPGVDGPIIFPLALSSFISPLVVTLTSSHLLPAPAQGINTFADAVDAMLNGETYVNVHTTANPGGELRGQVGPVTLRAALNGAQEVPPAATGATGTMTLSLSNDQTVFSFSLSVSGLGNITAAHIHAGAPGVNGPILFTLATGPYSSPLTGSPNAGNLTPQPSVGIVTFEQAVDAMISGQTYVNVHTTAFADGEIRGQLLP